MAKVKYEFNPYKPLKLKKATTELDKLKKQRDNLETRLRNEGIDPDTLGGEFDNRNFLEKAFNLTPDQGPLMDFFEILQRPTEAVKAAIVAGGRNQDFMTAAWEGLSGQKITEGGEVLDTLGIDLQLGEDGTGKFLENLAVDLVLDPLNLIPSGFFLKRFGKLFTRSKVKLLQEFTGNVLEVFSKVKKLDGTQAVFKNLDELNDFLRNASAEEAANVQRQLDDLIRPVQGQRRSVFEEGARPGQTGKQYDYGNTFNELKERAERLTEMKKKIDEVDELFKKGDITAQQRVDRINDILPDSFSTQKLTIGGAEVRVKQIKQQVLTELDLYSDAMEVAKRYGDDFDVVLNKTGNRLDDVTIVKKIKVGDKNYYISALNIEAKTAENFYLKTATLVFENGAAALKSSNRAFNFSEPLRQRLKDFMNKQITTGANQGRTLNQVFEDYINGRVLDRQGNAKRSFRIADELDDAAKQELKDIIIDMYKESSNGPIWFKEAGKKGFLIDLDTAKQYINIDNMTIGYSQTGSTGADQLRMLGYAGLDLTPAARDGMRGLEVLISEGKAYGIEGLIEQSGNLSQVSRTAQVNIFEYYQDAEGLIGDFAEVGVKFINWMKDKFSLYGFLTPETAGAARKLKGETAVQYQTRILRLANLRESFQKQFPNLSDRYLAQLVEAGARIDDTGAIVFADRTVTLKDYLASLVESSNNGNPGMLRKFARGKERQFLNKLNEVGNFWAGTNGEVYFEIVERRGVKVLQTNLDSSELKKILVQLDVDGPVGLGIFKDEILDYGKYNLIEGSALRLSADAENVLRNWDGYNEFVDLHHDVQRLLVEEGGFTNFINESGQLSDTYLRHMMTKQAYEYLSKNQPGVLSQFAKPGTQFFKQRKYIGSIEEVNDYLKAIYDLDMEVFDPSAFRAAEDFFKYAFRNIEQGKLMDLLLTSQDKYGEGLLKVIDNTKEATKAVSGENIVFTSFREEFPQLVKNLSETQIQALEGYLARSGLVGNRAIAMNRSIHRVIKESEKAFKALDDLTKLYDGFLNTWKGLTLVTPGFHLRNLFGNMFNSYVAGMDTVAQLKYTRIGMLELADFDKAVKLIAKGEKFSDLPRNLQKAYDRVLEFQKSGLIQSHRGVRDLEQLKEASELGAEGAKGVKKLYNEVIRLNFNLAEKMDDTQRYILYRWGLDKYGDANKAAKIVTDSLFDYSALTGFEKDVMKRLFPFYTFMKNNFIFHAKNILANPKLYARTGRAYKYYLEDIAGYGPGDLPDYMVESMWIPIPMMVTKNDKAGIAFLKANLPITDFMELVQNPFEKGVQSITAPVKLMIELGVGRDMFTGQPLTKFPGQTNVMQEGTGVLSGIRNQRGQLTIAQTPLAQKILNDIGLRTPLNFGTVVLDTLDTLMGYQGSQSGFSDFMERAGVASVQDLERLELTTLYQDLERLRELKKFYEQETGNQLPVLPRG